MPTRNSFAYLMLIIAVLVMPSAMSLTWYHFTKNPNFRPLGVTREALRAYTGSHGEGTILVAQVIWTDPDSDRGQDGLARALVNAFAAKGVDLEVEFLPGTGTTRVSYVIGTSVIGPYPASRAAQGISAAVDAYRMKVPVGG